MCVLVSLCIKPPGFKRVTFSNPAPLPKAQPLHAIVGLSFHPLNRWEWGFNLNMSTLGAIWTTPNQSIRLRGKERERREKEEELAGRR